MNGNTSWAITNCYGNLTDNARLIRREFRVSKTRGAHTAIKRGHISLHLPPPWFRECESELYFGL